MLDRSMLKELGVIFMREALCILKQAKEATTQATHIRARHCKDVMVASAIIIIIIIIIIQQLFVHI